MGANSRSISFGRRFDGSIIAIPNQNLRGLPCNSENGASAGQIMPDVCRTSSCPDFHSKGAPGVRLTSPKERKIYANDFRHHDA